MKINLFATTCLLMTGAVASAQTPAKAAPKPAGLGKAETTSNEQTNIRAYIELLRTDVRTEKSQLMAAVMLLDSGEATKFWPIYKDFETDYSKLCDQIVAVIREYSEHYDSMTDAVADKLANQVLGIEQQRNVLKKKYYDRMKESLGALTATRFLQVENQLERLIDLHIAAQLPVVTAQ